MIEPITVIDWEPQAAQSDLIDKVNEIIEVVNEMSHDPKEERAKAMKTLQDQGYSLRKIAQLFGYNHPTSVKHAIEQYFPRSAGATAESPTSDTTLLEGEK